MTRLEQDPRNVDALKIAIDHLGEDGALIHKPFVFDPSFGLSQDGWDIAFKKIDHVGDFMWYLDVNGPSNGSFVVKPRISDPEDRYHDHIKRTPVQDKYLPAVYYATPTWIVFERISGLESDALRNRIMGDRKFAVRYATKAAVLIKEAAISQFELRDVGFLEGRNCMVDPQTAAIKLIERTNMIPSPNHKPNEIITKQLLDELELAREISDKYGDCNATKFAFDLLAYFIRMLGKDNLYIRSERITPYNPDYRKFLSLERHWTVSDSDYQTILAEHQRGMDKSLSLGFDSTRAVSSMLAQAVVAKNVRLFSALLRRGFTEDTIRDPQDRRFSPVILPDMPLHP